MSRSSGRQRWALSFADLCLLLLGCVILLHARPDPVPLTAGLHQALGGRSTSALAHKATDLFEAGEAVLRAGAGTQLRAYARGAPSIRIASRGTDGGGSRLDGWELAAARAAAVAREMTAAGVAENKVTIAIDPATGNGQRLTVTRGR